MAIGHGQRGLLLDSLCHTVASMMKFFIFSPVFSFPFLLLNFASFFGGRVDAGIGVVAKGQGNEWNQSA